MSDTPSSDVGLDDLEEQLRLRKHPKYRCVDILNSMQRGGGRSDETLRQLWINDLKNLVALLSEPEVNQQTSGLMHGIVGGLLYTTHRLAELYNLPEGHVLEERFAASELLDFPVTMSEVGRTVETSQRRGVAVVYAKCNFPDDYVLFRVDSRYSQTIPDGTSFQQGETIPSSDRKIPSITKIVTEK